MKQFDLQGVEIRAGYRDVYAYIADPMNLPQWAHAFKSVADGKAELQTPAGTTTVALTVKSSPAEGTVDWYMAFPDGSEGRAYSRVTPLRKDACLYAFTLLAPPVPLEMIEGALAQQSRTLATELRTLKEILEKRESKTSRAA
jgi:hypothetical protein